MKHMRLCKSLSQGIADAYIYSWKVKFMFRTKRPSMRIIELSSLLPDPPSPGYVSELATVSRPRIFSCLIIFQMTYRSGKACIKVHEIQV